MKDYYKILGIDYNASDDEIKKAYRTLAKKYHPDVSTEEDATEKFKEINEAYQILSDKDKKYIYDNSRNTSTASTANNTYYNGSYERNFFYAKICPHCGKIVDINYKYCPNCKFDFNFKYDEEKDYTGPYFTGSIVHGFILGFVFNVIGLILAFTFGKKRTMIGSFAGFMVFLILVGLLI